MTKKKKEFRITFEPTVDEGELDEDDPVEGGGTYHTYSEDEALDMFHNETPISMLENYNITCEEV